MSQDIETKSDHSIGLNVSTNITNQTDSGTMGYKYLVYAMCNEYPTFEIPVANASEHCSNGVINESCCEVQENMYRKCICEYVEQGPFVFPVCHWSTECSVCSNSDICDDPLTSTPEISTSETSTITTEISTTEEITTKTNPFSTMSYTWPKDLECPELSQPKNGTIFCNSNFYECNLLCDPGFVPWQLKFDVENNNDAELNPLVGWGSGWGGPLQNCQSPHPLESHLFFGHFLKPLSSNNFGKYPSIFCVFT